MDQERRLAKAKVALLLNHPFFGHLALHLEPVAKKGLQFGTMGNDGSKLYYDPDGAITTWSDEELKAVVAHEVMHCVLGHLWRRQHRDPLRWNVAADYALNLILVKDGFKFPEGGLLDKKYEGMSAEEIYQKLPATPT